MKGDIIKSKLLQQARDDLYSWATNDLTCQLAKEVMSIGLAKLKLFYQEVGLDPDNHIIIIFGPDGSVTRNKTRFKEGVGYGCIVATKEYIFPSLLHPNGCGYGLYRIEEKPPLKDLISRLKTLKKEGVPIGEYRGKWDVWKSNHFIDIIRLEEVLPSFSKNETWLSPGYYVLIHSSQQIEKQKLSYWNAEEFTKVETTFGSIEGLTDESRQNYLDFFAKIERYSQEKRSSIARELFGEDNVTCIANPTHQGYFQENKFNVMRLGLYNTQTMTGEKNLPLFPMGFTGYTFIYLYEGQSNIKERYWTNNQLQRAKEKDHIDFIKHANILPHGGGYRLLYPFSAVESIIFDNVTYFKLHDAPVESQMLIQNIEELEYGYRGPGEILPLVDHLKLGERVARFTPIQVIKF
ncbi:MAG: hypothetical protein ACFE95_09115 [Candidatus Hodarchaeota archaeon]